MDNQNMPRVTEQALQDELNKRYPIEGSESAPDAVRMRVALDRAIFKLGWLAALTRQAAPEAPIAQRANRKGLRDEP